MTAFDVTAHFGYSSTFRVANVEEADAVIAIGARINRLVADGVYPADFEWIKICAQRVPEEDQ